MGPAAKCCWQTMYNASLRQESWETCNESSGSPERGATRRCQWGKKFALGERRGLQERAGALSNSPALLCNSPRINLPQSSISEQGGDCFQHARAAHLLLNSRSLAQKGPQASLSVTSVWAVAHPHITTFLHTSFLHTACLSHMFLVGTGTQMQI